jgi:broad specificity phosphatase PhoE
MNQFSHWLRPERACTAIIMRHAARGHFNHPAEGASVPITPQGEIDAEALGRSLAQFSDLHLAHSPVGRCRQTAEALGRGAMAAGSRVAMLGEDGRLGGPYMLNVPAALDKAGDLGHRFVREWFDGRICSSLLKSRRETAREQIATVDDHLGRAKQGLVVMVTHDWNLLAVREEFFGVRHEVDQWPGFMDGLIIWRSAEHIHIALGDAVATVPSADLARLTS